jgi:hypothetical protein
MVITSSFCPDCPCMVKIKICPPIDKFQIYLKITKPECGEP